MAAVLLRKIETRLNVRPGEWRPLLLAFAYFFFLLAGYYILRPVREQFGIANRVENLQYLYTGTFVTMLAIIPRLKPSDSSAAPVPSRSADISPMTHMRASTIFDFPQPLGPTTPVMPLS